MNMITVNAIYIKKIVTKEVLKYNGCKGNVVNQFHKSIKITSLQLLSIKIQLPVTKDEANLQQVTKHDRKSIYCL